MPNKYCQKCNKPTTYSDAVPAYCSLCGNPFANVKINSIANQYEIEDEQPRRPLKKIRPRREKNIEEDNEVVPDDLEEFEDDEIEYNPRRRPKFNVSTEDLCEISLPKRQSEKLGDLMLDQSEKQQISRPTRELSQEEFLKEWQSELSKKPSQEVGGGERGR